MGKDVCKSLCVLYRLVTCFEHIDTKPHFYRQAKDSKLYFLRANNEVTTYLDEKTEVFLTPTKGIGTIFSSFSGTDGKYTSLRKKPF